MAFGSGIGLSGVQGSAAFVVVDVAAGTPAMHIQLDASVGDGDLLIGDPDGVLVASEIHEGTLETAMISQPKAGRWTVGIGAFRSYIGTLSVTSPPVTPLGLGAPLPISGRITSQVVYKINVPHYSPQLVIQTSGGTGDLDLFVARGYIPACESGSAYCVYDSRSIRAGNSESVTITNPSAGDWYITLNAFRDFSDATLVVTAAPPSGLLPSQSELTFYTKAGVSPAPQSIVIGYTPSITDFIWNATVTATAGWLQVSPGNGSKGTTVTISPNATGLAAGTYRGTVNITAAGVSGSPRQVAVTLVISAASVTLPSITSVVNGASFTGGSIAPGTWITIHGTALATTTRLWGSPDFNNGAFLPTALDNIRVKVNGKDALVYYISSTQINVLSPDDDITGPVPITVTTALGSTTVTADLQIVSPAFFMFDPAGRKYIAAVHPDSVLVGPSDLFNGAVVTRPAAPGGRVLLYATGFGPTTPSLPANQIVASPSPIPASSGLEITVGGVPAIVEFSGLVSNGLFQFNVVIPNVPDGDQAVVAKVGGVSTPPGSLTIRH